MAKKREVKKFLADFFRYWPPRHFIVPREEYKELLSDLGITPLQCREAIYALSVENYAKGPETDKDRPDQSIWVFGTHINGEEVYIKLTLFTTAGGRQVAKCISFHKAKWGLTYPFR